MTQLSPIKQFRKAILYYKLTNRSQLNILVPYQTFMLGRDYKNTWPIAATFTLILLTDLAGILLITGVFTPGKSIFTPLPNSSGPDYGPLLIVVMACVALLYITYKYVRALVHIWRLSKNGTFNKQLPDQIKIN